MKLSISSAALYRSVYALFCLLFMAIFIFAPEGQDDIWYWSDFFENALQPDGSLDRWKGIVEDMRYHFLFDNSRWCNMTAILIIDWPQWLRMSIIAIAFAAGMPWVVRLANVRPNQSLRLILLCTLITFGLPWSDYMFSFIFASNYAWSLLLACGCACVFLRGKLHPVWAFLIGTLASCWQEGYAGPLLAGSIAVIILHRKMANPTRFWVIIGLMIGVIWFAGSPGSHLRTMSEGSHLGNLRCVPFIWVEWVYLAIWGILLLRKSTRKLMLSAPYAFFTAGALVFVPTVYTIGEERVLWVGMLFSICGLTRLTADLPMSRTIKNAGKVGVVVAGLFTLVHLAFVLREAITFRNLSIPVVEDVKWKRISPDEHYRFIPMKLVYQSPAICLQRPFAKYFEPVDGNTHYITRQIGSKGFFAFLPEDLRSFTPDKGIKINEKYQVYRYGDYLVSTSPESRYISYCYADFPVFSGYYHITTVRFTADDGNTYYFHNIYRNGPAVFFNNPDSIEFYTTPKYDLYFLK